MELFERVQHTRILGYEFLTWLWYQSDQGGGQVVLDTGALALWFDTRLTFEAVGNLREQSVVRSDAPTHTEEARASLLAGKLVREARMRIGVADRSWTCTLRADDLSVRSIKLPALLAADEDERLLERLALIEEIHDLVDGLFAAFVAVRLDAVHWEVESKRMGGWATT